tara:strand:- start:462 stop:611 length:150 start_codon:yes stop_codon:yes gene_type:complete
MTRTHFIYGTINVVPAYEATFWIGSPQFMCEDDPELGYFDESEFTENDE